jgi:hypothetical protein
VDGFEVVLFSNGEVSRLLENMADGVHELEVSFVDVQGQLIPLEGIGVLFLVVVGHSQFIVEHESVQLWVLLHSRQDVSLVKAEFFEEATEVDVCYL